MSDEMNERFLAACKDNFDEMDINKDGTLTVKDLGLAMEAQGINLTQEELDNQMEGMCKAMGGKDGTITFHDFAPVVFKKMKQMKDAFDYEVELEFKKRDEGNTGRLTFAQVLELKDDKKYFFKGKMSVEKWEENIKKADVDGDGTISIEELVSMCFLYI